MTIMTFHGPHLPLSHLGLRRRGRRTSFPSPTDQPPRRRDLPRPTADRPPTRPPRLRPATDRRPTAHSDPRPTADPPPTQTATDRLDPPPTSTRDAAVAHARLTATHRDRQFHRPPHLRRRGPPTPVPQPPPVAGAPLPAPPPPIRTSGLLPSSSHFCFSAILGFSFTALFFFFLPPLMWGLQLPEGHCQAR